MALALTDEEKAVFQKEYIRRKCLDSFPFYMDYVLKKKNPAFGLSAGHRLLCDKLQLVEEGKITKLMTFCPSSWGKTTILSHGFPSWVMARNEGFRLIGASHNGEFAENKVSRRIQDLILEHKDILGITLASTNAKEWTTSNKCEYRAAGVTAGILGERADGGIIDDPFGDIADAKSGAKRASVYDWYRGAWSTRFPLGFPSWQILMHQRLHMSDLAGVLLEEEGEDWEVLYLPARFSGINWDGKPLLIDELGRTEIGQSIWPEVWTNAALTQREKDVGAYSWASMYQQRPTPAGGSMFLPARLQLVEHEADLLKAQRKVLAFDYAAGKARGDWTVGCLMQENVKPIGGWTILDLERGQGGPDGMEQIILDTAEKHAKKYGKLGFKIFLPQDSAAAGAYMSSRLTKALAGYDVSSAREGGDKELRATPFAAQVCAGNVSILMGKWNKVLKDEFEVSLRREPPFLIGA